MGQVERRQVLTAAGAWVQQPERTVQRGQLLVTYPIVLEIS